MTETKNLYSNFSDIFTLNRSCQHLKCVIYCENLSKLIDIQDGIQKFDDYEDVLNDEASKNPDFLYAGMTKQNINTV